MASRKPTPINQTAGEQIAAPRQTKAATYVAGSHSARVRAEHDERRTELLALRDVLEGQRSALVDQIEDIGEALMLLSDPGTNVVSLKAAE